MFQQLEPYIQEKVTLFQKNSRNQYDYDLSIERGENNITINKIGHVFVNKKSKVRLATVFFQDGRYLFDTVLDEAEKELLQSLRNAGFFEKHIAFGLSGFNIEFDNEQQLIAFMDQHIWSHSLGDLY